MQASGAPVSRGASRLRVWPTNAVTRPKPRGALPVRQGVPAVRVLRRASRLRGSARRAPRAEAPRCGEQVHASRSRSSATRGRWARPGDRSDVTARPLGSAEGPHTGRHKAEALDRHVGATVRPDVRSVRPLGLTAPRTARALAVAGPKPWTAGVGATVRPDALLHARPRDRTTASSPVARSRSSATLGSDAGSDPTLLRGSARPCDRTEARAPGARSRSSSRRVPVPRSDLTARCPARSRDRTTAHLPPPGAEAPQSGRDATSRHPEPKPREAEGMTPRRTVEPKPREAVGTPMPPPGAGAPRSGRDGPCRRPGPKPRKADG